MRVAIVSESFLPQVNGVSNTVRHVAHQLLRSGHEPLVIAPGPGPSHHDGVPVVRVRSLGLPGYKSFPLGMPDSAVERAIAHFQPDVVHLASPIVLGAIGLRAARRWGIPTVAVYQTDIAGFARNYGLRADLVVDVGRPAAPAVPTARWCRRPRRTRQLEALGVPRPAPVAARRRARPVRPATPRRALHRRLVRRRAVVVGYVGRLAPEKQVRRLAELAGMPGIRLVVVGDGPERACSSSPFRTRLHRDAAAAPSSRRPSPPSTSSCTPATSRPSARPSRRPRPAASRSSPRPRAARSTWSTRARPASSFDPHDPASLRRRRLHLSPPTSVCAPGWPRPRSTPCPSGPGRTSCEELVDQHYRPRCSPATTRPPRDSTDRPAGQLHRAVLGRDEDGGGASRSWLRRVRCPAPAARPGTPRLPRRDRAGRRRPGARPAGRWRVPADRGAVAGDRRARAVRAHLAGDLGQVDAAAGGTMGAAQRGRDRPVLPRAAGRDAVAAHRPGARHRAVGRGAEPDPGPPVRPGRGHVAVRDARVPPGGSRGRDRRAPDPAGGRPGHLPTTRGAPDARRRAAAGPRGPAVPREEPAPGGGDRRRPAPPRRTRAAGRLRHRPAPRRAGGDRGRRAGPVPRARRGARGAGRPDRGGRHRPVTSAPARRSGWRSWRPSPAAPPSSPRRTAAHASWSTTAAAPGANPTRRASGTRCWSWPRAPSTRCAPRLAPGRSSSAGAAPCATWSRCTPDTSV